MMVPMTGYMWVRVDGDIATVGLTDEAQRQLGDIVYVDLPKPGATIKKDKAMGTVESVKSVSDLVSPVSGTVVEVNGSLAESPEKLNQYPEGEAWLVRVKLSYSGVVVSDTE
jgi:glycine cleavage system H protein